MAKTDDRLTVIIPYVKGTPTQLKIEAANEVRKQYAPRNIKVKFEMVRLPARPY